MVTASSSKDYYASGRPAAEEARNDLIESFRRYELWGIFGWYDVKQRYRRSVIGPFWLTISMGVTIAALGFLYSQLFGLDVSGYLPFLAVGFIMWQFIAGVIGESSQAFTAAEGLIKQARAPLATHILRMIWRNVIILGHNMLIYLLVVLIFGLTPGLGILSVLPAFALILVLAFGTSLALAALCTRYRDIGPLVQNLVQLAFFITPVIWKPELLPQRTLFLDLNPFYHVISILRAPLLGEQATAVNWMVCGGLAVVMLAIGLAAFAWSRRQLPYWL